MNIFMDSDADSTDSAALEPYLWMTFGGVTNINSFATAKGGKHLQRRVEVCYLLNRGDEGDIEPAFTT